MNPSQLISIIYDKLQAIVYNPSWENGTGYFNGAVNGPNAPKLESGEIVKSIDLAGRKIIIIGTKYGNIVMFQRYSKESSVVVSNLPLVIKNIFGSLILNNEGSMTIDGIGQLAGVMIGEGRIISQDMPNIGNIL